VAVCNFCRIHGSLECTPAMAAGVIDKPWNMNDLYNAVMDWAAMDRAERKRKAERIQKLLKTLRSL
jgi:hypothetical protein